MRPDLHIGELTWGRTDVGNKLAVWMLILGTGGAGVVNSLISPDASPYRLEPIASSASAGIIDPAPGNTHDPLAAGSTGAAVL